MDSIIIYYHVNTIGNEYDWTSKDCPQTKTVEYNELMDRTVLLLVLKIQYAKLGQCF